MDPAVLAKAVVSELLGSNSVWFFLLTIAAISGAGAYFGKYLSAKGEHLATKEDFNQLQRQLGDSTRLVESVRSEIARTDWAAREWDALRLKKIEELMTTLQECESYLDKLRNWSIEGKVLTETAPYNQPIVISELYLPELSEPVNRYVVFCRAMHMAVSTLGQQTILAMATGKDPSPLWENFIEKSVYSKMIAVHQEIRTTASQLLRQVMLDESRASISN